MSVACLPLPPRFLLTSLSLLCLLLVTVWANSPPDCLMLLHPVLMLLLLYWSELVACDEIKDKEMHLGEPRPHWLTTVQGHSWPAHMGTTSLSPNA